MLVRIRNYYLDWRSEYPRWLKEQSLFQKLFPVLFVAAFWIIFFVLGSFRSDHLLLGALILLLSYLGPDPKKLLTFLWPLALTAILYDSQRFYSDLIRARIRIQEPYLFDRIFFGIRTGQAILTPNEWFQLHTHPALDLFTGFFYLTFILIFVLICAYFYFWLSRRGTPKHPASVIAKTSPRMMWSFFWLNVLGFSTYYWYPAAPPWYVAKYGLGPVHMEAAADPAGCIRFDQLLGTHFFSGMYARSADVFGAVPSLHIAYPLLCVLFAFQMGAVRTFSVFFYLIMCFSAVYLNHHYILDILWGSLYSVIIFCLVNRIGDRRLLTLRKQQP